MLKSRSFFFFNTANPLIRNGGFLMESKKEIYDFIPAGYYPKTVLIKPHTHLEDITKMLEENNLQFPLIAKPDIGMRGFQVAVLKTKQELEVYGRKTKVDFLVQEYIPFENEIGIFYCRLPNEQEGFISGIVGKEFLSVKGDGHSTVEKLLLKNDRGLLQWKILSRNPDVMNRILAENEKFTLVPFGNHCRGAKFIDLTHLADDKLQAMINTTCKKIPEFYYGRLDIRFNSWEELQAGKNFSIIELNGAGSEPTHIYDPKHSIFFAWREIIRHLNILFRICKMNKRRQDLAYLTVREGIAMLKANRKHVALISQ